MINHNLVVQEAADVTAGVDSALATLKSSMAAISEFKEANKYASRCVYGCPMISVLESKGSFTPAHVQLYMYLS